MKRLRDIEAPLANFFASGVLALGEKLGPILWQVPESLPYDEALLDRFYRLLPATTGEASALAERHDDRLSGDQVWTDIDADRRLRHVLEFRHRSFCTDQAFDQMREHGIGCVIADAAGRWPQEDVVTSDVFVYFDNDARGHAPYDAMALADRLGLRVPSAGAPS